MDRQELSLSGPELSLSGPELSVIVEWISDHRVDQRITE